MPPEVMTRSPFLSAWMVFCHNDALGALHPECCIENAFGDDPAAVERGDRQQVEYRECRDVGVEQDLAVRA